MEENNNNNNEEIKEQNNDNQEITEQKADRQETSGQQDGSAGCEQQNRTQQGNRQELPPQNGQYYQNGQYQKKRSKTSVILPVIAIVLAVVFLFSSVFSVVLRLFSGAVTVGRGTSSDDSLNFKSPYIAELSVNGVIQGDTTDSLTSQATYHHSWTVNKIKALKADTNNKGLIMYVNTPGGAVYEADELYLAIKDYKETTGRPVYSYMASEAASGGYYISAPCDQIIANRNCWTGSIGVTIGTLYDITGLLKKYGVKTVSIHAGKNKAMGSYTEELTEEQQDILQSLVDEAYEQFVGIVAEGRNMDLKEVKKLADGRIYTAKQAKANGLIDEIGTFDEAVQKMKKKYELEACTVQNITYPKKDNFLLDLLQSASSLKGDDADSELDRLQALMDKNGKFSVTYLAAIDR